MESLERFEARLDNIRSVEPILSALRTISLASWQMALNQRIALGRYRDRLSDVRRVLPAQRHIDQRPQRQPGPSSARSSVLVIGSERGLCGRFNALVVERTEQYLADDTGAAAAVELVALGSRVARTLKRHELHLEWEGTLSLTRLPPYRRALDLTRDWLSRYEAGDIAIVDLIYNSYRGMGRYAPTVSRLLPSQAPVSSMDNGGPADNGLQSSRTPAIIETDPTGLYQRLTERSTALKLYEALIDSATAEHSTRYQLMDGATQNADRLIAELTMAVQTARQQAITRDMQELAAGAGLVGARQI